jgi:CubicO group peptidase (beta-lactamase class C family)
VTEKYRQSIDLMEGITDIQNKYVKYVSPTFFGGVSPWPGDGNGNPGPQPSADYSPIKTYLEGNIGNYKGNVIFDLRAPSGELYSFTTGQYNKDSRLKVMSHSKFTTGVIIAYLIDQGKLSLDTRAGDVIRSWDRPDKAGITIRQIMGHLSGIPDNTDNEGAETLEDYVNWLAGLPLEFTPGTQFKYSTVSYQVVARMAELVTGKRWKDLFKEILVDPCEMGDAAYNPSPAFEDLSGKPLNPLAGYGLVCSANQWANFISMIRDGGIFKGRRVLNPGVFDILKTRTSPGWSDWGTGVMFTDGQYVSEAASGIGTGILPFKYAWTIFTKSSYNDTFWSNRWVREKVYAIFQGNP